MRNASTRAPRVSDEPLDLNRHRGMAAQKATDIRRILLRSKTTLEACATGGASWKASFWRFRQLRGPEAAAKARYVLNLYAADLAPADTHHPIWSRSCWRTSPGSPTRIELIICSSEIRPAFDAGSSVHMKADPCKISRRATSKQRKRSGLVSYRAGTARK
jgi:hypothetical protein